MRRLLLSTLLLCACQSHDPNHPEWDASVTSFLGEDRVVRMDTATEVRALRVNGEPGVDPTGSSLASGFPIIAEGPLLSTEQRDRFLALARNADHYMFDVAKACIFMPGVGLRFDGPAGRLEALFCFSCDEWAFAIPTASGELDSWVVEDCDAARGELLKLARELFPDDEPLSKLR